MTAPRTSRVAHPQPGVGRIIRSPFVWGPLGAVLLFTTSLGLGVVSADLPPAWRPWLTVVGTVLVAALYVVIMRGVAGRRTPELTGTGGGRELVLGIALGTSFVAGVAGVVALLGGYDIAWAGRDVGAALLEAVMLGAAAGVLEELMFRGFVLQALERIGGSGVALAVTALIFGAMHLMNDGATLLAALTISVEAGLLLGAAFLWRRDLRFVIGIHLAWNATEALLGIPVSGGSMPGLWTTTVHGSDLLTGGGFGLEASVVTVLLSLVPTTLMLIAAHRRGSLRSVPWRRRSGRDVPLSPAPARTG